MSSASSSSAAAAAAVAANGQAQRAVRLVPVRASANASTIADLVSSVDKQPKFGRMVCYSMQCLRKLAVDPVSTEEILHAGTLTALQKARDQQQINEGTHQEFMDTI